MIMTMKKAVTKNAAPKTRTTPVKTGTKPTKAVSLSANPTAVSGKRYAIVNRTSGKTRRGAETRAEARSFKKENERIWDSAKRAFVR